MNGDNESIYSIVDDSQCSQDLLQKSPQKINKSLKRKNQTTFDSDLKNKKTRIMSLDDKKEFLSILDPEEKLSVWKYIDRYTNDAVVRDYVDIILEFKELPTLPSQENLKQWLNLKVSFEIPNELKLTLTNNFLRYFQSKYFKNNMEGANAESKCVFNPKTNFWVPNFDLLPELALENLTDLKKDFVLNTQSQASTATLFVLDLMILRSIKCILSFIKYELKITDVNQIDMSFKYLLATSYQVGKNAFLLSKDIKCMDWKTYESKVKHTEPSWRRAEQPHLPSEKPCCFGNNFLQKLSSNTVEFSGTAALQTETKFLNGEIKFKPTQQDKQNLSFSTRNNIQHGRNYHNQYYKPYEIRNQNNFYSRPQNNQRGRNYNPSYHYTNNRSNFKSRSQISSSNHVPVIEERSIKKPRRQLRQSATDLPMVNQKNSTPNQLIDAIN